jgi:cytochrome c
LCAKTLSLLSLILSLFVVLPGCDEHSRVELEAAAVTHGNPSRGRNAIVSFGCGACHVIPGISGANGNVGPPLSGIATRTYVGGVLKNTPENMIDWLRDPRAIDDKTAMPDVGLSESQAHDVAAYLYTLR